MPAEVVLDDFAELRKIPNMTGVAPRAARKGGPRLHFFRYHTDANASKSETTLPVA